MSKPSLVDVIYIASTAEKLFEALTDSKMSERYWFGNRVESDWTVGASCALGLKREGKDTPGRCSKRGRQRRGRRHLERLAGDYVQPQEHAGVRHGPHHPNRRALHRGA